MTNDLNYFNCPYSPHDQTTSWPFHYLSFTKVAKRFQLCKFFIEEIANLPFKFSVAQGRMYQQHRVLRAVTKI